MGERELPWVLMDVLAFCADVDAGRPSLRVVVSRVAFVTEALVRGVVPLEEVALPEVLPPSLSPP